jgi:hypothetical protein
MQRSERFISADLNAPGADRALDDRWVMVA